MNENSIQALLDGGVRLVNIGVADFAATVEAQGAPTVQVEWTPAPELGEEVEALLETLL